jgi:hypothetical protein
LNSLFSQLVTGHEYRFGKCNWFTRVRPCSLLVAVAAPSWLMLQCGCVCAPIYDAAGLMSRAAVTVRVPLQVPLSPSPPRKPTPAIPAVNSAAASATGSVIDPASDPEMNQATDAGPNVLALTFSCPDVTLPYQPSDPTIAVLASALATKESVSSVQHPPKHTPYLTNVHPTSTSYPPHIHLSTSHRQRTTNIHHDANVHLRSTTQHPFVALQHPRAVCPTSTYHLLNIYRRPPHDLRPTSTS